MSTKVSVLIAFLGAGVISWLVTNPSGTTGSKAAAGLVVVFSGAAVFALTDELLSARFRDFRVESYELVQRQLPGPDIGVLICNAADEKTLVSVARQLKVETLPNRSERKRSSGRVGSVSVAAKVLKLGRSSSNGTEDTEVFEDTDDTNVLLGRVLRVLDDTKKLRRDLVRIPALALETDAHLDDSEAIARIIQNLVAHSDIEPENVVLIPSKGGEATPASENIDTTPETAVVDFGELSARISEELRRAIPLERVAHNLRQRWSDAADGRFALIEGPWNVEQVDDGLLLRLAALTVDDDSGREQTLDMPTGLAVECRVADALLLDHRSDRIRPSHRMSLGVFGVVSHPAAGKEGTLVLEPTAVFERLAAPT